MLLLFTLFLDCGANMEHQESKDGRTTLFYACQSNFASRWKSLLFKTLFLPTKIIILRLILLVYCRIVLPTSIEHQGMNGRTALFYATLDSSAVLSDRAVNIEHYDNEDSTALLYANKLNHVDKARLFMDRGASQ
jgi:hypothetical protein